MIRHYVWLLPFSTARHVMFGLATERDGFEARPVTRVDKTVWSDARFGRYDCDFFVQYYWSRF